MKNNQRKKREGKTNSEELQYVYSEELQYVYPVAAQLHSYFDDFIHMCYFPDVTFPLSLPSPRDPKCAGP